MAAHFDTVNWPIGPASVDLAVSPLESGLSETIRGTLHVSRNGFVYSLPSCSSLRLKFLGLAVYLSTAASLAKGKDFANACLNRPRNPPEVKHLADLSDIAWKAAFKTHKALLPEKVEEFALAEMQYNTGGRPIELDWVRSERFGQGVYTAKCMQPLFHKEQARSPVKLQEQIFFLQNKRSLLLEALQPSRYWKVVFNSYRTWKEAKISEELHAAEAELARLQKQLSAANRCHKYACWAIFYQQSPLVRAFKDVAVETQAEVECCGQVCYKQQKICGLLYKIDCCATRCWALDCFCCFCCVWPDGRRYCII